MKEIAFSVLLLFSTFCLAAPNPAEYSINVHVSSSRWVMEPTILGGPEPFQKLDVVIDGRKCELEAPAFKGALQTGVTLLALGDYKAKVVPDKRQDKHKTVYESSEAYEFLFPDNTTRKFTVVGRIE